MNKEDWPKLDVTIKKDPGFLLDSQIANAIDKGRLLTDATKDGAKYACYELHIGRKVEQLVLDSHPGQQGDLYRGKIIGDDGAFFINPGETFKLYAAESLNIPADVFALAVPVGNMYKLGLNPETTFADPGFTGPFFVTVCNYSHRVVKLVVGDPLARMFFCKLAGRPDRIHEGKPRELPPAVERVKRPTMDELKAETDAKLISTILAATDPPHYQHAYLTDRLLTHHLTVANERAATIQSTLADEIDAMRRQVAVQLAEARRAATVSVIVAMACSFVIFLALAVVGFSLLQSKWPSFSEGMWSSVAASVVWVALILLVGPFRKAFLSAVREVSSPTKPTPGDQS